MIQNYLTSRNLESNDILIYSKHIKSLTELYSSEIKKDEIAYLFNNFNNFNNIEELKNHIINMVK